MSDVQICLLIIFCVLVAITFAIILPIAIIDKKYKTFVLEHSNAIKELKQINNHYHFNVIKNYDLENSYDNENYYDVIQTRDYLIYQLVYMKNGVLSAMNDAYGNKIMFDKYKEEVAEKCNLNRFDTDDLLKNKKKLAKTEQKLFSKAIKNPQTFFNITVYLSLTKINGRFVTSKYRTFEPKEIRSLIGKINNRRGDFFLDNEIWNAICRVERGKVTNRLRFAIYARDGYRCRKCGRKTNDLEIDHIIPISKGGKTTYDNLQTLCHRCNKQKGSDIEGW